MAVRETPDSPASASEEPGRVTAASVSGAVSRRVLTRPTAEAEPAERARAVPGRPEISAGPDRAPTLESIGAFWWSAFDAADAAVRAAGFALEPPEVAALSARLAGERASTVDLLEHVARDEGRRASFSNVLVSRSALRSVLGLPSAVRACVFNLDGVLIASAELHSAAWAETLDPFVDSRVERTGGHFARFDPRTDYLRHFHGKPRLNGVRGFLASRGIALPEGEVMDRPGAETVHGLANRKKLVLLHHLDEQGVQAFDGSRRYLEAARDAGIRCGGVSASANTGRIVERAGLSSFIEQCVDGNTILERNLRPRPAPDIFLAACDLIGVGPEETAVFETSVAGVEAAHACGARMVVCVDTDGHAKELLGAGADVVVAGLAEILERNVRLLGRRAA
jgi:HAD superfamily hydrolase (TIGR01509 family)